MPAVITHHLFGAEALARDPHAAGASTDERDAFLLGNQGPDPLFYAVADPRLLAHRQLGSTMHARRTSALLAAFAQAVALMPPEAQPVARAYAHGFLCHYSLDSCEHPLIYAQQYAICDAGVEGLTRSEGGDVHAVIESSLDEAVLFAKTGQTIETWRPYREALQGSDFMLAVASAMHTRAAAAVYGEEVRPDLFEESVRSFRRIQRLFWSPGAGKRRAFTFFEQRMLGRYSFYDAMAQRPIPSAESPFDNRGRATWTDPFTDGARDEGFWDLWQTAQAFAAQLIAAFDEPGFDEAAARELTRGRNFSGNPVEDCEETPERP